MPRKKSKKNMYFHEGVQDAIIRYNALDPEKESAKRSKIYQEEIHPAFDKLSENMINTFKFEYFDDGFMDVKHEVVAFMVMNIHKYDHTTGSKAFSYFSVVAKNYLILNNNNNYKRYKTHDNIDLYQDRSDGKMPKKSEKLEVMNINEMEDDFLSQLIVFFENLVPTLFKKRRDIDISYAIIELMRRRDEIENFNKKSLYILIREMTGVNTNNITKILNILKIHYKKAAREYHSTGMIGNQRGNFF